MLIYNSYTRSLEEFKVKNNVVNMYVCGPTVYNYLHFGNARPMIFFDIVRRYFLSLGNEVNFTSNITDVDDKIIDRAILENKSIEEITDFYFKAYLKNITDLNNLMPTNLPKVTEHMDDIIKYIDKLIEKGAAYEVNGNVYFKVSKVLEYGNLSNQKIDDLEVGARIEENNEKLHPNDFTLWKKTDVGTNWESPWSKGRPGWHTECVVMIDSIYGSKIDIHAGGMDLKFPHHENEVAQSLALNNHNLADFWMHNGLLNIDNSKMSKSLNNFILIKDLLCDYTANKTS